MSDDIVERLRTFDIYDYADADKICREAAARIESQAARIKELEKAVIQSRSLTKLMKPQADRIAELEAALHKIADRTKRAHPQAQEGEIHHIAIAALTNNTQENING